MMKFGSKTYGLGDTLLLTAVCKYFPNEFTIQLPPDKEHYAILFKGLADVEITDQITPLSDIGGGAYAIRKLRNFFGDAAPFMDYRPLVLYSDRESEEWATHYIRSRNIAFATVVKCAKHWDAVRSIPKPIYSQHFLKNEKFSVLIESSSNPCEIEHPNILTDIPLPRYICLLRQLGAYAGCNTGDMHLAAATGCALKVYQPSRQRQFNPDEWNYRHPTIQYLEW